MTRVLIGTVVLIVQSAALADGSRLAARRLYGRDTVAMVAAAATLWVFGVVAILEILGVAGALHPLPVLALALLLWLSARMLLGRPRAPQITLPVPRGRVGWIAALAAAGLLAILVVAIVEALAEPRRQFDALDYHLPIAVQWLQAGNLRLLPMTVPTLHEMQFPANFELVELWLLIAPHRDFLVQLAGLPGIALAASGIVLLARSLGAGGRAAGAAALVFVTLPTVLVTQVGGDLPDLFVAGALTVSAGFVARSWRTAQVRDLVLGGIAAGLAVGARYQALLEVLPLAGVLLVIEAGRRPRARRGAARLALPLTTLILAGGYFYVRNASATGNPIWPRSWSIGLQHFPGARDTGCCEGPSWLTLGWHPSDWAHTLWRSLFANTTPASDEHSWGPLFGVLLAAGVVLPVLLAIRKREREAVRWAWALYPLAQFAVYLATPLSAGHNASFGVINSRFLLVTAAASACALAALSEGLGEQRQPAAITATLVAALLITGAYSRGVTPSPAPKLAIALLAAWALTFLVFRWAPKPITLRPRIGAAAGALFALCAIALAVPLQRHFADASAKLPYADVRQRLGPSDRAVAVVGPCQIYGLYGDDLRRQVRYYGGAGGFDPPLATTYPAWISELRRHRVTAIVVRPAPEDCFPQRPPQFAWLISHLRGFTIRYRSSDAASGRAVLLSPS